MTPKDFNRSLSRATGESVRTIKRLGFSPLDPSQAFADSEGLDLPPQTVDWDQVDRDRILLAIQA